MNVLAFVVHDPVEAFLLPFLPELARIDVQSRHAALRQLCLHRNRNELHAVITTQLRSYSVQRNRCAQHADDALGRGPQRHEHQPFARELLHYDQNPQRCAIGQRLLDNIVGPDTAEIGHLELIPPPQLTGSFLLDKLYSVHQDALPAIAMAGMLAASLWIWLSKAVLSAGCAVYWNIDRWTWIDTQVRRTDTPRATKHWTAARWLAIISPFPMLQINTAPI